MEKREEKKKERWAASLQPAYAQELGKFVREIGGPFINSEELNYYMNWFRESYKKSL